MKRNGKVALALLGVALMVGALWHSTRTQYFGPIAFPDPPETMKATTWSDDWISFALPEKWSVGIESKNSKERFYSLTPVDSTDSIGFLAKKGGPRFIPCLCGRKDRYDHTEMEEKEFWCLYFHDFTPDEIPDDPEERERWNPPIRSITFKAAGKSIRIAAHQQVASLSIDPEVTAYVTLSARPLQ